MNAPFEADTAGGGLNVEHVTVTYRNGHTALKDATFAILKGTITALVGVNQWLYVAVGACPASLILRRAFDLRSVVYPRGEQARG